MTKLRFRPVLKLVLLSAVSLSLLGCSGTFEQETRVVRVSPVSEEYKLTKKMVGKTYILLAETSTGQEQYRYAVSDSLARAMKKNGKGSITYSFLNLWSKSDNEKISKNRFEVLSFTDLANKLNEKDVCRRHARMIEFYQQNGMFRKSDLEFMAKVVDADYLVQPCLLNVRRWDTGRFSVFGLRILQTQIICGMLGMEIWDTRTGHKVFSAISDVTIANEKIKEEPISIEEAFERAWLGIFKELPG